MRQQLRSGSLWSIVALVVLPIICGLIVLAGHAPRDWSLHWTVPRTVIASTTQGLYGSVQTPRGWDVVWVDPAARMYLSRFDRSGKRIAPDIAVRGSPTASLTLGRVGSADIALWRQDYNGGSQLRDAVIPPSGLPIYHTLATGSAPLEHPQVFSLGSQAGIVFSWQRPIFNVYLDRVDANGRSSGPVRLTHVAGYAFLPHAVVDASGAIQLVYLDENAASSAFNLIMARYSRSGSLLGPPRRIDSIASILSSGGAASGSAPNEWGLDIQRRGREVWVAYSGDAGVTLARILGGRLLSRAVIAQVAPPSAVSLSLSRRWYEISWPQNFDLGVDLTTVQLDRVGLPIAAPDRVAFESATDSEPTPILAGGLPAFLWQATPNPNLTHIELSHYSPAALPAPNLPTRLGLGLADPLGNIALLIFGSLAFGALITIGNVLLILFLTGIYIVLLRILIRAVVGFIPAARLYTGWKWYLYLGLLAAFLYLILVPLAAPFPPVLFLNGFTVALGLLAVGGMIIFVWLLMRLVLRRFDEGYRLAGMTFAAFYFIAFLQAVILIQGQLGKI